MSSPNPDDTTELRRLLAQARPKAHYDVEAGAQRHRQLVAQGAPPPDWASAALQVRRVPSAWMWSVLGGALLLGVWALQTSPSASSEAARVVPITVPPVSSASDVRPTIEPLVQAVPPQVAPQPAAHQPAVAAAALQVAEATPALVARPAPASTLQTSSADKAARTLRTPRARVVTAGTVATPPAVAPLELDLSAPAQAPTDDPASLQNTTPEQPVRSPAPDAIDPEVLEEMQQLATAERLLPTMPSRTLALVREGMQRFQRGYLAQERRYLEIMALLALKMPKDAELLSRGFLRDYPKGPYRRKVERALEDGARD